MSKSLLKTSSNKISSEFSVVEFISPSPKVATVIKQDKDSEPSVLIGKRLVSVSGYITAIPGLLPKLENGQQVLVLETEQGAGILGCWQSVGENEKAEIDVKNGRLRIEASESVVLKSGESNIEIHKNGKIRVDGKDIYNIAEGPLRLQGSVIELN